MEVNEVELQRVIEKAVTRTSVKSKIAKTLITITVIGFTLSFGLKSLANYVTDAMKSEWTSFADSFSNQFHREDPAESHDLVLENHGILGYTASDFSEAILGNIKREKELTVYTANISDVVTNTKTGLGNFKIFTKSQLITFNGTATYTVDLENLTDDSFVLDTEKKTLTVKIPHAKREKINIPSDEMEFGDVERGWLAFGDIKMTAEEFSEVETMAKGRMEQKLEALNEGKTADEFAIKSVWELYQPFVTAICPECKLAVEIEE